jgi:hypothetical protein
VELLEFLGRADDNKTPTLSLHYEAIEKQIVLALCAQTYKRLAVQGSPLALVGMTLLFPGCSPDAEYPEVFYIYKKCETWGNWWAGGVADQPHVQMTEFAVCKNAENRFKSEYLPRMEAINANAF